MTDNPLLTQQVITSDGREAVVLEHRCNVGLIYADIQNEDGGWEIEYFSNNGTAAHLRYKLIPKPAVHPAQAGTRTYNVSLCLENEGRVLETGKRTAPAWNVTLTDGDPASAVVEVVLSKGEG